LDQHSPQSTAMWLSGMGDATPSILYEFDRVHKLDAMWVWNSNQVIESFVGLGAKDVVVESSVDGVEWTVLDGVTQFNQAPGSADYTANTIIDFAGTLAQSVKITINAGYGMMPQYGLSAVRFYSIPTQAREPMPLDAAITADVDVVLTWRAGREAAVHEVVLSDDSAAVMDGSAVVATTSDSSYSTLPLNLSYGSTYYWRIIESNAVEVPVSYASAVWSFSTPEYAIVDNFDQYDDDCRRIFFSWLDGWGHNGGENIADCDVPAYNGNGTGALVGANQAPFAERTRVVSGQAMPLAFDNSTAPYYSETQSVDFGLPGNWSGGGADTLSVSFRGQAGAFLEKADGSIVISGGGVDIQGSFDEFRYAYRDLSGDGSLLARIDSLTNVHEWAKAGVMIRESINADAPNAFMTISPTPSHGASWQHRDSAGVGTAYTNAADIVMPYWVRVTRAGDSFTGEVSLDGLTWETVGSLDISMAADACMGIAITSHVDGDTLAVSEVSEIAFTGGVMGNWKVEDIGADQPSQDAAEPVYIVIKDSAGQAKTITHPSPNATQAHAYTPWLIPFTDLAPLNLSSIKSICVGVGKRDNPQAGGAGMLYIDDILVGKPN